MHSNQKGLSLVEILAGILLLGIITTLTTIIIMNSLQHKDVSSKEISLKQDTNLMISQLRKEFFDEKEEIICFNTQAGRITIIDEINGEKKTQISNGNGSIIHENGRSCIKEFDRDSPVELELYTQNENEKQVHIKTTLRKGGNGLEGYSNNDPCDLQKRMKWQKNTNGKLPCGQSGNFKITSMQGQFDKNSKCTINGSVLIDTQFDPTNLHLNITKNACFLKSVTTDNSTIDIGGQTSFRDAVTFKNRSELLVKKNADFKNQKVAFDNSLANIKGKADFNNAVQFDNDSKLFVKKNAMFSSTQKINFYNSFFDIKGETTINGAFESNSDKGKDFYIGSNAFFIRTVNMKANGNMKIAGKGEFGEQFQINKSNFTIVKDALFKKETQIYEGSKLVIGGDLVTSYNTNDFEVQNSSSVYVSKNATFKNQSVQVSENSKLCIEKNVIPDSIVRSPKADCNYYKAY